MKTNAEIISFTCKRFTSSFDIKPFAGVLELIGYTTPTNYLINRDYFCPEIAPQQRFNGKYASSKNIKIISKRQLSDQ